MVRLLAVSTLLLLTIAPATAQDSSFVPPDVYRYLSGEISGDIAYDHIRHLTLHHSINAGSQGYRDKIRWIAEKAKQVGLQDVHIIEDLPYRGSGWTVKSADLIEIEPLYQRIASYDGAAVMIADNSSSGDWTGELIDVGEGAADKDYEGKEVKGKIVLTSGSAGVVVRQAVRKRGALGIVSYNARNLENPDQIAWTRLPAPSKDEAPTFAFSLSNRAGSELRQRLARGQKLTLRATVSASFEQNVTQWMVEGFIRGKRRDQAIVLTAHVQEEKFSANDDNSGCASLLEIGRALTKLIAEGKLPQPERDIRFWWPNEISGEYAYFSKHPEERSQILLDLNQDMVGAKQSVGSRIQHITRTPWSRPSYLNDVIESIVTMVMRGNTSYLSAEQTPGAQGALYSKPILSMSGTRERFGAEIVPYFSNTDHMVFVDSIIGIPAATLTNWPDTYIHSSYDDLWQVDPTQLQRNAFIVAATAWYFARLQPAEAPVLVGEVYAGAHRRLAADFARASSILASERSNDKRLAVYSDCQNLIDRAAERETAAIEATKVFTTAVKLPSIKDAASAYKKALRADYVLLTGSEPEEASLSETEKAMAKKVPEVALGVAEYIEKRGWGGGGGLHNLMSFEVTNFVDGKRSYLDIYRAVRAEAQAAGDWYYGTVSADAVNNVLEAAVKKGLLRLKGAN